MTERKIKSCCANFYESDVVRLLLGDALHPGGLQLTEHMGTVMGFHQADRVLDVACGCGTSAVFLAERFHCHVTGLDCGVKNIAAAEAHALKRGVVHRTTFRQGDGERLPFKDGVFDAVISECSFCTFPDKLLAASEMHRVLRSGGRVGLADMTVAGQMPDDIQNLLSWVACISGAGRAEDYVATFRQAGFCRLMVEDQRQALLDMVAEVKKKLLGVELAMGLGKLDLGSIDLKEEKRLAQRAVDLVDSGVVGYTLIVGKKE
jgi:ubiquinone/menaquinone biosynthesis C-methylase UbiE